MLRMAAAYGCKAFICVRFMDGRAQVLQELQGLCGLQRLLCQESANDESVDDGHLSGQHWARHKRPVRANRRFVPLRIGAQLSSKLCCSIFTSNGPCRAVAREVNRVVALQKDAHICQCLAQRELLVGAWQKIRK